MTSQHGIKADQWQQILYLIAKHPEVNRVVLFGSRAMGTFRPGSDIDLALFGSGDMHGIINQILLGYDELYLPWKLDLISYNQITNPDLKDHIDRVGVEMSAVSKS